MSHRSDPDSGEGAIGLRVSVLGDKAIVESVRGEAEVVGPDSHPLLALMAMRHPAPISVNEVIREIETEPGARSSLTKSAFRARISRLNKQLEPSGVRARKVHVGSYRLDDDPVWVDALEFAAAGSAALEGKRADRATQALTLWRGELPQTVAKTPVLAPLADLREKLLTVSQTVPRRVLVLEDIAGHAIKRRLKDRYPGQIDVVVESNAQKVIDYFEKKESPSFDLVLLDFHLTQGDEAFQGYEVASAIRDGARVMPVLGMSYHRSDVHNDMVTSLIFDLWDVMPKRNAAGGESLDKIVARALKLVDTTEAQLKRHYVDRVPLLRQAAEDELGTQADDPVRLKKMAADADALVVSARKDDLGLIREKCRDFAKEYLPRG